MSMRNEKEEFEEYISLENYLSLLETIAYVHMKPKYPNTVLILRLSTSDNNVCAYYH